MKEINWKKGFFRLTFGLSILIGLLAGAKAEDSHDLGWAAFLATFVEYLFDPELSTRTSDFDSDIFWSFFAVYTGFTWLLYLIGNWSGRGFSKNIGESRFRKYLSKYLSGIVPNPSDRFRDETTQD